MPTNLRPKFSVLISVYTKEHPIFFREALRSLVDQVLPANQVVLVCDGPLTPLLNAVIDDFVSLLPLTIIRLPINVGLALALNAGLKYCEHEWIARFDTDDICEKLRFVKQVEFIGKFPNVDVFGSNILEFTKNSQTPHAMRKVKFSHEEILAVGRFRNPMNHMTVFFRKAVVANIGGYPQDTLNEDYALWVRLIMNGCKFSNLSEPLVKVRAGQDMVSRRGGLAYLKTELRMQRRLKSIGFISGKIFVFNVFIRVIARLSPNFLRQAFYYLLLRSRP